MTQPTAQAARPAGEPPRSGAAIRTEDLRKTCTTSRGDVPAVRGIGLEVATGEFFGLLGPNGAGNPVTELRLSLWGRGPRTYRVR